MRKAIILLISFLLTGFTSLLAQDIISVEGLVTDESTGAGIAGQEVTILVTDSANYHNSTILTDASGYYMDTLWVTGSVPSINVSTPDNCSSFIHDTTLYYPVNGTCYLVNFAICNDSVAGDCQADFTYVNDPIDQLYVSFYDQSTPVGNIDSWYWDFGDGNSSNLQNPVHVYNSFGTYNVCLTITTDDSCTSIFCQDVTIGNTLDCQADFNSFPDSTNQGTVYFYDLSYANGNINSWFWEFGDGSTSTEQNPTHVFNELGTYNVCLTITADSNCTSTYCQDVLVGGGSGGDCLADFNYFTDSTNQGLVYFYDLSIPVGNIETWFWDFGDGTGSGEQNPTHTFSQAGTYNVCLTITTFYNPATDSCISITCKAVVVSGGTGGDCQADFTYFADSSNQSTIYFYDLSTAAGNIDTWFWDFGDGTSSTDQNPTHSYNAPGTYSVCLTITADSNCTSIYCEYVVVQGGASYYYLGGNTFAGIYQLDHGFAYAYKSENGVITEVHSQMVDSLGYYLFYPFAEGDYYTKVEPSPTSVYFGTHLPTYYGDVIHWEDAVLISLNQDIFNADINLVEMTAAAPGSGIIKGHIVYQGGNRDNTPASDIQIMLANQQGEYVGIYYSDEEGYFEFTGLANGTYTLFAEIVGKSMVPSEFTLSDESPVIEDIVMIINSTNVVFGIDDVHSKYIDKISDIYPNPVSSKLKIDVGLKEATQIECNILSLTGQTMSSQLFDLSHSATIELETAKLTKGMYLLEIITADKYRISKRFIKY